MIIALILLESIAIGFLMLVVCIVGLKNGPEKFVAFYDKDVQERVVELGYTTKKEVQKSSVVSGLVLLVPVAILVPLMVCWLNGARGFFEIFWQITAISWIAGLFDRLFIDGFWVGHTKAWLIPSTEDLMPYIPKKTLIKKWTSTIIGFPILAAGIAGVLGLFVK